MGRCCWVVVAVFALLALPVRAGTIDFEGLLDGEAITNQFSGVVFNNAVALIAGISLNEFEAPPRSGSTVAGDNGGPMLLSFAAPLIQFSGYFTYLTPLTLTGFDGANNQIASAASLFPSNLALSGDPGSSPNEFIELNAPGRNLARVEILGAASGDSFVVDDITFTPVPEPASLPVTGLLLGMLLLVIRRAR